MSTSICVEAVSTMVWPRNETGGLSGVGQISNWGPITIVLSVKFVNSIKSVVIYIPPIDSESFDDSKNVQKVWKPLFVVSD